MSTRTGWLPRPWLSPPRLPPSTRLVAMSRLHPRRRSSPLHKPTRSQKCCWDQYLAYSIPRSKMLRIARGILRPCLGNTWLQRMRHPILCPIHYRSGATILPTHSARRALPGRHTRTILRGRQQHTYTMWPTRRICKPIDEGSTQERRPLGGCRALRMRHIWRFRRISPVALPTKPIRRSRRSRRTQMANPRLKCCISRASSIPCTARRTRRSWAPIHNRPKLCPTQSTLPIPRSPPCCTCLGRGLLSTRGRFSSSHPPPSHRRPRWMIRRRR